MCSGFPVEEESKYAKPAAAGTKDDDFVLNYKLRGSAGASASGPVPTYVGLVGGEMHKCMGSR